MHGAEHKIYASLAFFGIYYAIQFHYKIATINFWMAWLLVILGAYFPDIDLDFGSKFHRSFWTHGHFIPLFLQIVYLIRPDVVIIELFGFFFMGYASHLLLDIFPSHKALLKRFWSWFRYHQTPGDIRGIPERYERPWLITSGLYVAALSYLFLSVKWGIVVRFLLLDIGLLIAGLVLAAGGISIYRKYRKRLKK